MRLTIRACRFCALAGAIAAGAAFSAQERDPAVGCWQLRGPPDSYGLFHRLPETIFLDSLPPAPAVWVPGARRVVLADSPRESIALPSEPRYQFWSRDERNRLHLANTNGFVWLASALEGRGDTLRGEGSTGDDTPGLGEPPPRWEVTLVRVPCPARP